MSPVRSPEVSPPSFLEPLEPRIAPALVINVGVPVDADGVPAADPDSYNYKYAPPGQTNPFTALGPGDGGHPVYELSLGTGRGTDEIRQLDLYTGGKPAFGPWITIKGSSATAFFTDFNRNDVVDDNELTGIAFTSRLNLTVNGSVNGDIIGNGGGLGSSLVDPNGPSISFLKVAGPIQGSVVAAGSISNVTVVNSVERISTASPGDIKFNFGLGETDLRAFVPAAGFAGGALNNIKVAQADVIQAGFGGSSFDFSLPGAAGGSINKVTVVDDPDGVSIIAGHGGSGSRGGTGGSVAQIQVFGAGEATGPLPPQAVLIQAGDGGSSITTGGKGGNVANISIGYALINGKLGPSPEPSGTPVVVGAGNGGDGSLGGAGGSVSNVKILVETPDRPDSHEISVAAGHGGAGTARDGAGGSIKQLRAENLAFNFLNPDADRDSILVRAGNAGEGSGEGARGGSVSNTGSDTGLLADRVEVFAGNGSQGTNTGGAGGSLSKINLLFTESEQVRAMRLEAGQGGDASNTGRAGAGGSVTGVSALSVDLLNDDVFTVTSRVAAGDGGNGGRGGSGGSLGDVRIFEPGTTLDRAQVVFRAGHGGDGLLAGGGGGGVSGLTFIGFATLPTLSAGDGGLATAGQGGKGGALRNVSLRSDWVLGEIKDGARLTPQASVSAGAGGDGQGAAGRGGSGGSLSNVNARVSGPLGSILAAAADGTAGGQTFINATPDAPALVEWRQFNPGSVAVTGSGGAYTTQAALVDVGLRVNSSLRGEIVDPPDPNLRASFTVANASTLGLPPVSVTGATAQAEVLFVGRNAPDPVTAVLPTTLTLLPGPANVGPGQTQLFEVVSLTTAGGVVTLSNIQPLRPIVTDLLSTELDTDPFFTGLGLVGMSVSPDLDVSLFIPNALNPADVQIDTVRLFMAGTVELTYGYMEWVDLSVAAGRGGDGLAAVGAGGSVSRLVAATLAGNVAVSAGDAGDPLDPLATTVRRAAGGSIANAMLVGSENVTIQAGDGAAGGNGGSIRTAGWFKAALNAEADLDGLLAPTGNIVMRAGQGSSLLGSAGGVGGSVTGISGLSSSAADAVVLIAAGDGGGPGGGNAARGAAGGSISNVNFFGGLVAPTISAGHGGDALAGAGGQGGSVTSVSAPPGLDILQVAAGDGGDGTTRGGGGGSLTKINVFGDIGIRSGEAFGFATAAGGAGGLFAGAGGSGGGSGALDGKAGRVVNVTASAISSIVAGRPTVNDPQSLALTSLVDRIYLRGLNAPTLEPQPPLPGTSEPVYNGAFSAITSPAQVASTTFPNGRPATTAFGEANLVGSIAGDPFAPGANVYKTVAGAVPDTESRWILGTTRPLDGLVAALSLGQKGFRPEAWLTTDPRAPGTLVLVDYRNNSNANS